MITNEKVTGCGCNYYFRIITSRVINSGGINYFIFVCRLNLQHEKIENSKSRVTYYLWCDVSLLALSDRKCSISSIMRMIWFLFFKDKIAAEMFFELYFVYYHDVTMLLGLTNTYVLPHMALNFSTQNLFKFLFSFLCFFCFRLQKFLLKIIWN